MSPDRSHPHRSPARRHRSAATAAAVVALLGTAVAGCAHVTTADDSAPAEYGPGAQRVYGAAVPLGQGRARTYVVSRQGAPVEIGVALDERALEGLPAASAGHAGGHADTHPYDLALPAAAPAGPFTFVELDWNPAGHEPDGVYDQPHFDFHFYTITKAQRDAIDPASPRYAAEANNLPAADLTPPFYALPLPPGTPPAAAAVPRMGVHLVDMRSPELQAILGNAAAYKPFTSTFIHGAWDGRVTFYEPMVTRALILSTKSASTAADRDRVIPIPSASRHVPAGHYPGAYRITWDAAAQEYHIALTQLAARN